ncbi:hypothetical protein JM189_03585 [Wolbachia endosymbiont of Nasonia vitripennis]|nr:WPE palindromic element domain-containing protein [Wolbachia endosymbiont of Muscidifurax uniraptor]
MVLECKIGVIPVLRHWDPGNLISNKCIR